MPGHIYRMTDGPYFLSHDLRQPFPLPDASFDWIFSEHFIEHVPLADGITWMRDMYRLLRPGGLLRVTTPDLRRYIEGYLDPERRFFEEHRARLSVFGPIPARRAWMVNQIFYDYEHCWVYDLEELAYVATEVGFSADKVQQCTFRAGRLPEVCRLDQDGRQGESIYVEITK
jgi:predicted SAM-dependent methyltransferase